MPANMARRLVGKIEADAADPTAQANNVKTMQERDGIRLRVGDWRVIMIDGLVLDVIAIGARGSIYDEETVMNEMVMITRAEYDRLREAAEDLADLDAYDRAIAAGRESIPSEYVNRMIDGESAVRVYRDLRGMTQTALATASGVNRVQIADIEAGRKTGSVATLAKLAAALGVTIDDLV